MGKPVPERDGAMLENGAFQAALGIAAYFPAIDQNIKGLPPGKTECCPLAKPGAILRQICSIGCRQPKPAVEEQEEGGQGAKRLLNGTAWGKMMRGTDQRIGQFVGMVDDAASGDAPDHGESFCAAARQIQDRGGILEAPKRQRRWVPAVEAEHRR